jgi:hypothetical protein
VVIILHLKINKLKYMKFLNIKPGVPLILLSGLLFTACAPDRDDDFNLGPAPGEPDFTVELLTGDSNRVVVTDRTPGVFQRLWDLPGGDPKNSTLATDTVFYSKAGEYAITLHVSREDGSGSSAGTKKVTIASDATADCNPKVALLTGDCGPDGKCWVFSQVAGAISVGPTSGSTEWYTSPAGGLVPEQYDDSYCFFFEGQVFEYRNNGATVNPWNGYAAEPYTPPPGDWVFSEGTGTNGADRIILPEDHFMGVRDADNVLDVVVLTADQLVVRARIRDQAGVPAAEGWFELHFIAQ